MDGYRRRVAADVAAVAGVKSVARFACACACARPKACGRGSAGYLPSACACMLCAACAAWSISAAART